MPLPNATIVVGELFDPRQHWWSDENFFHE